MSSNKIYDKNIQALEKRWPEYIPLLKEEIVDNLMQFKLNNINGKNIPIVYIGTKEYRLASEYDDDLIMDMWIKYIRTDLYELNVFLFGIGTGIMVLRLLKEFSKNNEIRIIIYEPSSLILRECIKYYDYTKIINDERVTLIFSGYKEYDLESYVNHNINYCNINGVHSGFYLNYPHLYEDEKRVYDKELKRLLDRIMTNKATLNGAGEFYYRNTIDNIEKFANSYSFVSLNEIIAKDIPAIIVSSGPSLSKNIEYLKDAKGKFLIIAVDSALGPLDKKGIIPDIYISVDPEKHELNFKMEWLKDIPVIGKIFSPQYVFKENQIAFIAFDEYIRHFLAKEIPQCANWNLDAGGSVANSAFKCAQLLGIETIVLVGQDLAYSGEQTHAKEVAFNDDEFDSDRTLETKDIYGNMVKCHKNFLLYKKWFEDQISCNKWCRVIDATEGGAFIEGTEVMSLHEAILELGQKEIDFTEMLIKVKPLFDDEQKKKYLEWVNSVPERMKEITYNCGKLLNNYKKMETLVKQGKISSGEMRRLFKYNDQLSKKIEENPAYCYIEYLNVKTIQEVEDGINKIAENEDQDLLNVLKLGKSNTTGIVEAAERVSKDFLQRICEG